jgi:hypothetical protein
MVDLSSSLDEEGLISDTSRDEEFAIRLFGDLNYDILGSPDDGKIIVLSDFDEEEEVHEETITDVAPSAAVKSPVPTTDVIDADEDPKGMQDDNSDGLVLDREIINSNSDGLVLDREIINSNSGGD